MTSGETSGTGGARLSPFWAAFAATAVLTTMFQTLTVLSALHDSPAIRPWWAPVLYEYSSGVMVLAFYPGVWMAARRFPPKRPWTLFVAAQLAASAVYCAAHVAGFVILRRIGYALILGQPYRFGGWPQAAYEYRKDVLSYAVLLLGAWAIQRLMPAAPVSVPAPAAPSTFDIRDGARLLRTPIADIRAVSSAGNYAQFHLADGRKPLMRATLASLEQNLAAHGFLRTHRSWLVNPAHVRAVEPEGSGDYRLSLTGGEEAPLSRRFQATRMALLKG